MNKLISIVINCYNGEKYVKNAIQSVIRQKYQNWELIFWDNQSTDNSKNIFKSFSDERLKYYYSEKKTTLYEARNNASKIAKGDYLGFIDCDDEWYENYLSSRKTFFENDSFDYSYSNFYYFYEKNNIKLIKSKNYLESDLIYDFLAKNYVIAISGLIFKKKILNEVNFFNPAYNIIGDYDFVMKISKNKKAFAIQDPLLQIRVHGNNFLDKNRKMFFREYCNWYLMQDRDKFFIRNKKYFLKKLIYLYFVSIVPNFIKDFFKKK